MSIANFYTTIVETAKSLWTGIRLTNRHFFQAKKQRIPLGIEHPDYFKQNTGIFTTQYPHEAIPIPDNGRNRLHNEIEDCIVCDLCAKICPVDCIEIEPIKSTEEIGKTSDGSSKRIYAARFDIDMAKCCYCGLCTTVCPTECLTMTNAFDYSEFDIKNMIYNFTDLSPAQAEEKRKIYEEAQRLKAESKAKQQSEKSEPTTSNNISTPKISFKPIIKKDNSTQQPKSDGLQNTNSSISENNTIPNAQPTTEPIQQNDILSIKNTNLESNSKEQKDSPKEDNIPKPKPIFKPIIKPPLPRKDTGNSTDNINN
ncbi:MAG: 4Fe-4S dicluster domain-containing protein [Cytophagales bacterium]|nr:MAG: 4Fe-4S dicluster domain-containing protein [Cytophagales bacterium]